MILYLVNINLHMGQMPLSACDQITMSLSWLRPQRKASSHHKRTLQKMNLNPSGSLEELDKLELGQGQARAGGKHRNLWTGLQPLVILLQTSTLSLKTLCEYFMIGIFNVLCVSSQSPSGFQRTQLSLFFFWGGEAGGECGFSCALVLCDRNTKLLSVMTTHMGAICPHYRPWVTQCHIDSSLPQAYSMARLI